jgi:hypothetical protein
MSIYRIFFIKTSFASRFPAAQAVNTLLNNCYYSDFQENFFSMEYSMPPPNRQAILILGIAAAPQRSPALSACSAIACPAI